MQGDFPLRLIPKSYMAYKEGRRRGDTEIPGYEYTPEDYACIPRLNSLSSVLFEEAEDQTGVIMGRIPYIQFQYDDICLTVCYELMKNLDDEDEYLFHIRTDIPVRELDMGLSPEEICIRYNGADFFSKALCHQEPFPIYGLGAPPGECITVYACAYDTGPVPEAEYYERLFRRFASEVGSLLEMNG